MIWKEERKLTKLCNSVPFITVLKKILAVFSRRTFFFFGRGNRGDWSWGELRWVEGRVTVVTIYCMKEESIFRFKSSPGTKIKSNLKKEEDITVKENGHQH